MKKQLVIAVALLVAILFSGCLSNPAIDNAKTSEAIQNFLAECPNASTNLTLLGEEAIEADSDFQEKCKGVEVKSYTKVVFSDQDSKTNAIAFVDNEEVVCAFISQNQEECAEIWQCSDWQPFNCPQSEQQTRTCTDTANCGTEENKPEETKTCNYACTESWNCTEWSECINHQQTRACNDTSNCETTTNKPLETRICTHTVSESWNCSDWLDCIEGMQTRSCIDESNSGTTIDKPKETRECEEECEENWNCGPWSQCINETQSRTCTDATACGTEENKPEESQICEIEVSCADTDDGLDYFVDGDVTVTTNGILTISDMCLVDLVELAAQYPTYETILNGFINAGVVESNQLNDPNVLLESYCPTNTPEDYTAFTFQTTYTCPNGCEGIVGTGPAATTGRCLPALAEPVCGNDEVEDGEECDDGNTNDGDGCSSTCTIEEAGVTCSDSDGGLNYAVDGDVVVTTTGTLTIADFCLSDLVELAAEYSTYQTILNGMISAGVIEASQVNDPNVIIEGYCPTEIPDDFTPFDFEKAYACPNGCEGIKGTTENTSGICLP